MKKNFIVINKYINNKYCIIYMTSSEQQAEKDYLWKYEQEHILKKWADKALCFKIMHDRSYKKYWCLNAWFNIPIIIISTITGTGNFASGSIDNIDTHLFILLIGSLNIFGGILATIATYTGIAQKLEAHRFASISWDKYSRKIQIELSKSRNDRVKAKYFIRQSADDYDRLMEISPMIPNDIIRWFKQLVETGNYEENIQDCGLCFYDWFCFPCGCNLCKCTKRNYIKDKNIFADIELPEIIGSIKPTEIAKEMEIIIAKDLTEVQSSNNDKLIVTVNEYSLYNLSTDNNIDNGMLFTENVPIHIMQDELKV